MNILLVIFLVPFSVNSLGSVFGFCNLACGYSLDILRGQVLAGRNQTGSF